MYKKLYRKELCRIVVVMMILFLFFSLSNISFAQTVKPLKIGVVYPMSGVLGSFSEGIYLGHQAAALESMKAGGFLGRPVEFILRDDSGSAEFNTRYCRELILNEKVEWILSGYGTTTSLTAEAVAGEFKVPTMIHGGIAEQITVEELNRYAFKYCYTSRDCATQMAKIMNEDILKDVKNPKVYWISWDAANARDVYKYLMPELKRLIPDVQIVGEAWVRSGETDYGPFISQMISLRPDIIVNIIWAGGTTALLKQGSNRGLWDISEVIGHAEFAGPEARQFIGMDMPVGSWGNTYDDSTWPWPNNDKQKKLYDLFYALTGKPRTELPPGEFSAGYYMVKLIDAAMQKAGTSETQEVIKAMEGITIESHLGPISVRGFDHQVMSYNIWAPMIKEEGLPYLVLDKERIFLTNAKDTTFTEEDWLTRRKAVGKGYLEF